MRLVRIRCKCQKKSCMQKLEVVGLKGKKFGSGTRVLARGEAVYSPRPTALPRLEAKILSTLHHTVQSWLPGLRGGCTSSEDY